jgi:hypothetical protein
MIRMKQQVLLVGLLCAALTGSSQKQFDLGFRVGGANYIGEIGGRGEPKPFLIDVQLAQTSPTLGTFIRWEVANRLNLQADLNFVQIRQDDAHSGDAARRARNLHFRNQMFETGLRADFAFLEIPRLVNESPRQRQRIGLEMAVYAGVAGVLHNPQARVLYDPLNQWGDEWHDLRPLRTEGQVESYSSLIVALPMGVRAAFDFGHQWKLGIEATWRTTFTDYLDDISGVYANPDELDPLARALSSQAHPDVVEQVNQEFGTNLSVSNFQFSEAGTYRGNPQSNDGYGTVEFTIARVLKTRGRVVDGF